MTKRKAKNPYKGLILFCVIVAVLVALCTVIVSGINAYEINAKTAAQKAAEEANAQNQIKFSEEMAAYQRATSSGESQSWPPAPQDGVALIDLSPYEMVNTQAETVSRESLVQGGLMLVNHWHPIPDDMNEENIRSVREWTNSRVPIRDNSIKLYQVAAEALDAMVMDAGLAGLKHYIVQDAYRSMSEQQSMFDAQADRLKDRFEGEFLIAETTKSVNYPGTSEFQSGFSFRMKLYDKENASITSSNFQDTDQGKWFNENAWKYGVIFRFPTANFPSADTVDKTYKTGVSLKMNLYRYVGVAHSTAMYMLNMCHEEYIEYLISHPHFAIYENGRLKYEVYRQAYDSGDAVIQKPQAASRYVASIDNMGGVVTAFYYE